VSGMFLYAASTPAWVGSFDNNSGNGGQQNRGGGGIVSDCVVTNKGAGVAIGGNGVDKSFLPPIASVLCVLDFKNGALLHQLSMDISEGD
jgi:hypothetical protein